jgi:hypothetical protein
MVKSAVLAWGSLVWDPRDLQTAAEFTPNGPLLPVEFCRISADGRLTLAIDETFGAICTTYSAPSALESLEAAIENLRLREGMSDALEVGFVELASGKQGDVAAQRHPEALATIAAWAEPSGYDAAIWTALASNFDQPDKGGEPFSVTARSAISKVWKDRTAPSSPGRWPISAMPRPKSRPRCARQSRSAGWTDRLRGRPYSLNRRERRRPPADSRRSPQGPGCNRSPRRP